MRLWLTHSTSVPIRDQIVRQISLGILSGELSPGERLPSVRSLGRRFHLHRNTVSSAYRLLEEEHWGSSCKGSGVYIRPCASPAPSASGISHTSGRLERLLYELVESAEQGGISKPELLSMVEAALQRPRETVLLESDLDLARIVQFEIASIGRCSPDLSMSSDTLAAGLASRLAGRTAVVLPSKADSVRQVLGQDAPLIVLQINPIATSLAKHLPPSRNHLVAIASHWPRFLELARTLLIAAGFEEESLMVRDAKEAGWTLGLTSADTVICDSLTRTMLPAATRPLVFPLLTSAAMEQFHPSPTRTVYKVAQAPEP